MYAKGMTTRDIDAHNIYGLEVSESTISRITDKILPIVIKWQQRPLESICAVIYIDAIHFHVRSEGQIVKKAVYIALSVNLDGEKDVLGMRVGENESAKYWASVLNQLHNRGVNDVLIFSTDNISGLSQAIESVFPEAEIQNCIIHQFRNSTEYVSYKDLKSVVRDLKAVYQAAAEEALDAFSKKRDEKYPKISSSWRLNWDRLTPFFKYLPELRRIIDTTNSIEGFNRQLRKVTKSKSVFSIDDSLIKMLYLAMSDITAKWSKYQNWTYLYGQLSVYFQDRLERQQ